MNSLIRMLVVLHTTLLPGILHAFAQPQATSVVAPNVVYNQAHHALSSISRVFSPDGASSVITAVILHLSTGMYSINCHKITHATLTPHQPDTTEVARLKENISQYIIQQHINGTWS